MDNNLISVALPLPLRKEFTYQLRQHEYHPSLLGSRVRVPFGNRHLVGFVSGNLLSADYPKIKPINELIDEPSLFTPELYSLLGWAANYYHAPLGKVLETALPVALRKGKKAQLITSRTWQLAKPTIKETIRGQQQQKILDYFNSNRQLREEELASLNLKRPALNSLIDKGLIEEVVAVPPQVRPTPPVTLTQEQSQAVSSVMDADDGFRCFLLAGPTNSGKTEVYIEIIRQMIKQGKQALFMVPEIALSPQTLDRLKKSLQVPLGLMHSQMTNNERLHNYLLAADNQLQVVIGTRSTIFTPFHRLGCIIVDEEHDLSYKQDTEFRYNGKHLAIKYAQLLNIPIILGSATPSLESYYNIQTHRYQRLDLTKPIHSSGRLPCRLLDMKTQKDPLPPVVMNSIDETLNKGSQVLVFINRRGFAPILRCSQCGWVQECSECDRPMTLHKYPPLLACHICEKQQAIPHSCPACRKGPLATGGFGTQKLADLLGARFPNFPLLRIDRDSMRKKASYTDFYKQVSQDRPCIFVGTQIVAKGHDFTQVRLAVIANCDQGLISPDFHSVEAAAQLITQVIGRVGRRQAQGKQSQILLPTYYPNNSTLTTLLTKGYGAFAKQELQARQRLDFPPYCHFAYLRAEATKEQQAMVSLQSAKSQMSSKAQQQKVSLLGPIECNLAKRNNYHRRALIIRSHHRPALHSIIEELAELVEKQKGIRWHIDMDPLEAP